MKETLIVAPHPDDEIIGCYEILVNEKNSPIIIYSDPTDKDRRKKCLNLKNYINVKAQLFLETIPNTFLNKETTIYMPDPIYEIHPKHRELGMLGEKLVRSGFDIIFYSVNMRAPYIHETQNSKAKEDLLNKVYPDQKSLWEYEKKYVLFEGRCKWLF